MSIDPGGRYLPPSELIAALIRARGPMDRRTEYGGILASGREPIMSHPERPVGPVTGAPVTNAATGSPVGHVQSHMLDMAENQQAPVNAGQVAAGTAPPIYGQQQANPQSRLSALLAMLNR